MSVRTSGGLLVAREEQLRVSGRDGGRLVAGSVRQQAAVRAALGADDHLTGAGLVDVVGVLCFLDAAIDGRWRLPHVEEVQIRSPPA